MIIPVTLSAPGRLLTLRARQRGLSDRSPPPSGRGPTSRSSDELMPRRPQGADSAENASRFHGFSSLGLLRDVEGDSNRISSGADVACSRPCRSNRKAQGLPGSPAMIVIHRGSHLGALPITPSRLWGTGAPKGPRNCSAKKRNTSTRILLF